MKILTALLINITMLAVIIFSAVIILGGILPVNVTENEISEFITGAYNNNEDLIKAHSNYKLKELLWIPKITKTFIVHRKTSLLWSEFWILFGSNILLKAEAEKNGKFFVTYIRSYEITYPDRLLDRILEGRYMDLRYKVFHFK